MSITLADVADKYMAAMRLRYDKTTNRSNTMTTKHSIYIVTIHGTDHAVRATGKRAAQAIALDARVSTRLADHDDVVRIVSSQQEILGGQPEPDSIDKAVAAFDYDKEDGA